MSSSLSSIRVQGAPTEAELAALLSVLAVGLRRSPDTDRPEATALADAGSPAPSRVRRHPTRWRTAHRPRPIQFIDHRLERTTK